jgi:hypothetical protein
VQPVEVSKLEEQSPIELKKKKPSVGARLKESCNGQQDRS